MKNSNQLTRHIQSILIDNLEYMSTCKDDQFDWAICDPNYGIGASKPSRKPEMVKQKNGKYLAAKAQNYKHKDWDNKPPPPEYFKEVQRVSKKQIIWGVNYYNTPLHGGRLVWDKLNRGTDQFDCEIAYLSFTKRTELVYYMWSGMMQGLRASNNIHTAYKQKGNKRLNEKRIHPTQKPIQLYKWILDRWVNKGETVFDSHGGSLSLGIACELHGCDFTACETDKEYYEDSSHRVVSFFSKKVLF